MEIGSVSTRLRSKRGALVDVTNQKSAEQMNKNLADSNPNKKAVSIC